MRARAGIVVLGLIGSGLGAVAGIEFNGFASDSGNLQLAFHDTVTGQTEWVRMGDHFEDYTLMSYDAKEQVAVLNRNGATMRVRFDAAPAHAGAAARASLPLAKARAIFNNLRKLSAAADQYYLLNGTTTTAYANLVGPNVFIGSLPSGEDYSTIVFNQKNLVYLVTTAGGVTVALDLSHGGTADESTFYPPKPGDTLATIARRVGKSPQDLAGLNEIPYPPLGPIGDVLRVR